MSEAISYQQQLDILSILENTDDFADIAIMAEVRGDTILEMQNRIAGKFTTGKDPGCAILVMEPSAKADAKQNTVPLERILHRVVVTENTMLNRIQGVAGGTTSGTNAAKMRQRVIQALIGRKLGNASLMWTGWAASQPKVEGQCGFDVDFEVITELPGESRNGVRIDNTGLTVTLVGTGAAGEVLRYTTDGSAPAPGGATVTTYTVPFAVTSGTIVRASATATSLAISLYQQKRITA